MTESQLTVIAAAIRDHFDTRWGQEAPVLDAEARFIATQIGAELDLHNRIIRPEGDGI